MEARFKVRQDLAFWASPCGNFSPGEVHVVNSTAEDMQTIADAMAAGVLTDVEWDDEAKDAWTYESDMASQAKLQEAMESGAWLKGHTAQAELDAANGGVIVIGDDG